MTSFTFLKFTFLGAGFTVPSFDPARSSLVKAGATLLLCLASTAHAEPPSPAHASGPDCAGELDRHVAIARAGDLPGAERGLEALLPQCTQLPQIRHGLGSLAARRGDWEEAVVQLEAAIALDTRTADTVESVRRIQRWRAAQAYARALGEPPPTHAPPVPVLHDSRWRNSPGPPDGASADGPREEAVLDTTLSRWWNSASSDRAHHRNAHYATDFQGGTLASSSLAASRPDWSAVNRDITFAGPDAVALVRWRDLDDVPQGRLMLLRPTGAGWTIYEERAL